MFRSRRLHLIVVLLAASLAAAQPKSDQEIEGKINALIRKMTIEEKAGQLTQMGLTPESLELARQGRAGSFLGVLGAKQTNDVQHAVMEHSRLKIPLIFGYDVIHGYRTVFPVPLASAGSFDMPLLEQAERIAAKEATASGVKWVFAPMVDIARDPRWGRIVEGSGEDPYLGSQVAAAKVRGFQGKSMADPDSVVACAKHYVAYGAVEGGRDYNTVDISERLLREVYLPPFHAAVNAGAGTLMSAFNDLNGIPGVANHHTLTDILRNEWHFDGFVVSDWGAVHELLAHGTAADDSQAALEALKAGVDMDMVDNAYRNIPELVKSGKLPMSVVDEAVRRVLRVKFRAGLFDHPYADPAREATDLLAPESLATARQLAQESMVLLENKGDLLPLKKEQTVAVIGPLADDKASQLGPWAGDGRAKDAVTPLEGIAAKIGKEHVVYAKGVDIPPFEHGVGAGVVAPAPPSATGVVGQESGRPANIDDAVEAARKADVALVFVGELAGMTGEASSRATLDLPGDQRKLIDAVVATGKPVILVLESGRPLDISWAPAQVSAILQAWFPGVQAGNAIADVLFGDVSPSGRLAVSWPRSVGQIPVYYNHNNTGRPSAPDRWHTGYLDMSREPLYPFGYGLSYTKFTYRNLKASVETSGASHAGVLHVTAAIENSGNRKATEVVQLYVHDRVAPTSRPVRELKGFERVPLSPGESKTVSFDVNEKDLGSYDPEMRWMVPSGTYDVWVAPDSSSGIHGTFEVK